MELAEFVRAHVVRGECLCGRCVDGGTEQPVGHTADLVFFKVALRGEPDVEELKGLIKAHQGEFIEIDLLDGEEHNYMDIGAWIGDQGLALMLMGMGSLLGLWDLMTPYSMLKCDESVAMRLAGMGMITVKVIE